MSTSFVRRAFGCSAQPEHAWGTGQLEICTLLENGRGMSGPELENLFHLGHARKHRERIDIDNAIYAHFGELSRYVTCHIAGQALPSGLTTCAGLTLQCAGASSCKATDA